MFLSSATFTTRTHTSVSPHLSINRWFLNNPCLFPFFMSWSFSRIRHKQNLLFLSLEPFCALDRNCDKDIFFKGFQNDAGVRRFLNAPASVVLHLRIKQSVLITTTTKYVTSGNCIAFILWLSLLVLGTLSKKILTRCITLTVSVFQQQQH